MHKEYSAIKRLLFQYGLNFQSGEQHDRFMNELARILDI